MPADIKPRDNPEYLEIPGEWHLEFMYAAGRAASRFLVALRDDSILLASPCPSCQRVYVPARDFCEDCFVHTSDDWTAVGPEGTVESFAVTYVKLPGYREPPYAVAYVRPDGADTAMGNFVSGVDLKDPDAAAQKLAIGSRMVARFESKRAARVTDFTWAPAS